MPFYRSVLADSGSGGGGGVNGAYFTIESNSENLPVLGSVSFTSYGVNVDQPTKITIGNRISSVSYLGGGGSWEGFNAPIDLKNAAMLKDTSSMVYDCNMFNSPVLFPEQCISIVDGESYIDYDSMFHSCPNYNQSTIIKMHDVSSDTSINTDVDLTFMFYGCSNFNSRVVFDFYKNNTFYNNEDDCSILKYDCNTMFYECENFNQPLVFPAGLSNFDKNLFENCNKFNQPLVVDMFLSSDTRFENLFRNHPNMSSDIIILNSEYIDSQLMDYYACMLNNNRTSMTNIFIKNTDGILNNYVVDGAGSITWTNSVSPYNSNCNVYTNSTYKITISEDVDAGLNAFNNYYYNCYGVYPVIPNLFPNLVNP